MNKKLNNNNIKINDKEQFKMISPSRKFKRRLSTYKIKFKEVFKKANKRIRKRKKFKLLHKNHEINTKLKEMQEK